MLVIHFFGVYAPLAKRFSLPIRRVSGREARCYTPKLGTVLTALTTTRSAPSALASPGASSRHNEPGSRPPPRAPRSHPVKPGATAPAVGEGTTAKGKPTGAPRATGPDEERRTNVGPRGTPERHAAGHNHGTRTGSSHNGHRVPRTREARTTHDQPRHGTRCQGQPGPHARTPHPRPVGSGPRPHARKDGWSGVGERPTPDAPHPGKRRPPRAPSCRPHSTQERALWGW